MTRIVATDLEGTLTAGATWRGVGRYLRSQGYTWAYRLFFYPRLPGALLAEGGLIAKETFREKWMQDLAQLLRGFSMSRLREMGEWVVEHELWPRRRTEVVAELEARRTAGDRIIVTSGTYRPVLEAFADRIGAECIGSDMEMANGQFTGKLGRANVGALKAEQLKARLNGAPLHAAYGDTLADLPMLEMSANPVVVHPDRLLRRVAGQRDWRILEG